MTWCTNRLTVIGSKRQVQLFQKSRWATALGAEHCELLENSPKRYSCQFDSKHFLLESLRRLSRRLPRLVFLLDYEMEAERLKGLAKVEAGRIVSCQFEY
jgi:hypothetical protein